MGKPRRSGPIRKIRHDFSRFEVLCVAPVLLAALFVRIWKISWVPGLNGDEAWYGIFCQHLLKGQPIPDHGPSGNPINWMFMGIQVLFSAIFEPSFTVLRSPAVLMGLLSVVAAYPIFQKTIGRVPALLLTVLVACFPSAIINSRISWDPCETVLASLIFLRLCWSMNVAFIALSFFLAMIIQPSNIMLLPMGFTVLAYRLWQNKKPLKDWVIHITSLVAISLFAILTNHRISGRGQEMYSTSHLFSLSEWGRYFYELARFLSGSVSLEYVRGVAPASLDGYWSLGIVAAFAAMFFALHRAWKKRQAERAVWIVGFFAAVLFCGATFGAETFVVGFERYGMFLIVPFALAMAAAMAILTPKKMERPVFAVFCFVVGAWLALFGRELFGAYFDNGAIAAHSAFHSNDPEPKAAAYKALRQVRPAAKGLPVLVEDTWIKFPLNYLDGSSDRFIWFQSDFLPAWFEAEKVLPNGGLIVTFDGSYFDSFVKQKLAGPKLAPLQIPMRGRKPLINIYGRAL